VKRLTLFAHHDDESEVKQFVCHFLRELREISDRLVFISTSPLPPREQARAAGTCDQVLLTGNLGFDFAMWQFGLECNDLNDYDELVLTNSSVFGPLWPLKPYMDEMQETPCDFWGMTENFEICRHVQSYFLVFKRNVLQSDAFRRFWASVLPYRDKSQLIRAYEVGLSVFLQEAGFTRASFISGESLFPPGLRRRAFKFTDRNLTRYYPERLVKAGMPFVKVEVLRDNPGGVPLEPIRRAMRMAGYDERLVRLDRKPKTESWSRDLYFHRFQRPLTRILEALATDKQPGAPRVSYGASVAAGRKPLDGRRAR
jgi:rhamnosyltransferase